MNPACYRDHVVFLSYCAADVAPAGQLRRALESAGATVLHDYAPVHAGERLPAQAATLVDVATDYVVILSPASVRSRWVQLEYGLAARQKPLSGFLHQLEFGDLPAHFERLNRGGSIHRLGELISPITFRAPARGGLEVAEHPVTLGEWHSFDLPGARRPVTGITQAEARAFAEGLGARLPTLAEWLTLSSAARAAPIASWGDIAWLDQPGADNPRWVAAKQPDARGLYDVLGNVWEWLDEPGCVAGGSIRTSAASLVDEWVKVAEPRRDLVGMRLVREAVAED